MPKAFAKKIKKADKIEIKAAVSSLNDLTLQKKAFISFVASNVLCNYLKEQEITVISENNIFSGLLLLKDFDIANITVENNIKIVVRAFVGDDYTQMCIPRSHFLNNILADIYVGVRLETTIDKAEFVGYIELDHIDRKKGNNKYISIDVNQLKPIDSLKQAINSSVERKNSHLSFDHEKARELFYQYIEARISSSDKEFFARHISSCTECSQEFNYVIELDNIIKSVGQKFNFEEDNEDYTLKLLAGDSALLGEEVEINISEKFDNKIEDNNFIQNEENLKRNINQQKSGQLKKKHILGRKTGRAIKAAGKLALLSGAVLGGGQIVSAVQAANVSGLVGSAVLAMAASSAKGISESLYSAAEHFNEVSSSGGEYLKSNNNDEFENFVDLDNNNNFDSQEEVNLLNNENTENQDLNFVDLNNSNDFDSQKENISINNEIVDNFEFNSDETENIYDLEIQEEATSINNEIGDNSNLTEEMLTETESPAELNEIASGLTFDFSAELSIKNDNEESIKLSDVDPESISLHQETKEVNTGFIEVEHKDVSGEIQKEEDLQSAFDDIAIEYNIDDILASFDNVEVVDSLGFFDFGNTENESASPASNELNSVEPNYENTPHEVVKLENEQKENIINEIYENQESVPEEYQGMKLNSDSKKEESSEEKFLVAGSEVVEFDEDQYEDEAFLRKDKLRVIDMKLASGIAAAGIAVTVAVALWMNNRLATNPNLPVANPHPASQTSSLPDPTGINNQNSNNTVPPDNSSDQTMVRHREPLHSYQKQVTSKDVPPPNKDLSAVLAEAFTRRTYEVDIRNISWEITADMAQNVIFKNYIMVTGQALKSALARDLASADERASNTQMEIKTVMDLNGNILEANVVQSSGSKEVDKICLDTYKTTIQFTKLPKIDVNRDKIKANLIISF